MSREEGEGVEKHCTNVFTLMAWGGFLNKNKLIQASGFSNFSLSEIELKIMTKDDRQIKKEQVSY